MFSFLTLFSKSEELKNKTQFDSFSKGVYSVTLESGQFVYYYSFMIGYGGSIASIITGEIPPGIQVGYVKSTSTSEQPSIPTDLSNISQENRGYVYTTKYNGGSFMLYAFIKNSGDSKATFDLAIGTVEVEKFQTTYLSTSEHDCFTLSNTGKPNDEFLDNSHNYVYMNINNKEDPAVNTKILSDNLREKIGSFLAYSYTKDGKSKGLINQNSSVNYKGKYLTINDVYSTLQFNLDEAASGIEIDAIEITVNNNDTTDTSGITCTITKSSPDLESCHFGTKLCYSIDPKPVAVFVFVIIAYYSLAVVLFIINSIMACIHPNRLFRLGCKEYCVEDCCFACLPLYTIELFYRNNFQNKQIYAIPWLFKRENIVYFCLFIPIYLIFLPFFFMYTLYHLCVCPNDAERAWELDEVYDINNNHEDDTAPIADSKIDEVQEKKKQEQQESIAKQSLISSEQQCMQPMEPPQQQQQFIQPIIPLQQQQQPMSIQQQIDNQLTIQDQLNPYLNL